MMKVEQSMMSGGRAIASPMILGEMLESLHSPSRWGKFSGECVPVRRCVAEAVAVAMACKIGLAGSLVQDICLRQSKLIDLRLGKHRPMPEITRLGKPPKNLLADQYESK